MGCRKYNWRCEEGDGSHSKEKHGEAAVYQAQLAGKAQQYKCELAHLQQGTQLCMHVSSQNCRISDVRPPVPNLQHGCKIRLFGSFLSSKTGITLAQLLKPSKAYLMLQTLQTAVVCKVMP
jgi:hypothetical protein